MAAGRVDWVALCAFAEAIGMTAAAGASRAGQQLDGRPAAALGVVVLGGLVEGTALGIAQAMLLGRRFPRLRRGRYVLATVLVAGLGWSAASAPSVLAGDEGGAAPPVGLVLLGAAGLGLVMGAALGAVQALVLRGASTHPWRWVRANSLAWPGAMVLIFAGATTPDDTWPVGQLLLLGALTGAAAGALLGGVLGPAVPRLGPSSGISGAPAVLSRITLQSRE